MTIDFTPAEIDMICSMWGIASLATWGEGDYVGMPWEADNSEDVFNSIHWKLVNK